MTPQQIRFCEHYASTLNATKSAILAGYSATSARQTAARLLTKDNIKDFCNKLIADEDEKLIAEANEILRYLSEVMRDPTAKQADRLRAAEGLAKFRGLFTEKQEVKLAAVEARPRVLIYLPEIEKDPEDEDE